MKTCTKCKETKALEEFNARKESKDGHTPTCKLCIRARRKQMRDNPAESYTHPELTDEQRKSVYTAVILRMREQGLTSSYTTNEMLNRVGAL